MTDVVVVGGGIIGLTAAVRLQEAGAEVTVWSPAGPDRTVSAVAAAVWYPTRTEYDPRIQDWGTTTYAEFTRQAAAGVPGLLLRPTRNLESAWSDELPWWSPGGVSIRPAQPPYGREVRFVAPLAEMGIYLAWLRSRVRVEERTVEQLTDALAEADLAVNATGLAARELAADPAVFPARGQIVLVSNPGLEESVRTEGDPNTYVHPRSRDVVLGGTFEPDQWDLTPDPEIREQILQRTRALVPALAGAEILGVRVGLRPCRRGGPRVERDGRIVHAYGHGGAGMTLSWGTADEVTRLCLDLST